VLRILDLEPGRRDAVGLVPTADPLRDDALEILLTGRLEEGGPAFLDMVDVPKPRGEPRYESLQAPLALEERPITEVLAVDFEQVEGAEIRPVAATKQEPVEVAAAIRLEARDLAVQDRPHRFHAVRDLLTEHVPLREDVATPRHQPALVPIDPG